MGLYVNAQTSFNRLVSQDFKYASFDDVKWVALAVWHENFVPDVSRVDDMNAARSANYLVDKLRRFNCVPVEQKMKLYSVIALLSARFELDSVPNTSPFLDSPLDPLALRWGLDSDLKLMIRELLPYQTRHYQHGIVEEE